jgi:hypothetical protein
MLKLTGNSKDEHALEYVEEFRFLSPPPESKNLRGDYSNRKQTIS